MISLLFVFLLCSCGKTDNKVSNLNDLLQTVSDSDVNTEEILYEGTYKGKINGKNIELKINSESFTANEDGKSISGSWQKVNDGTILGLVPKKGSISVKNYAYSDRDTWVALTDSMTYYEPEQYLKRVK